MLKQRHQLFEFNDSSWAPVALKESILETLGGGLRWSGLLRGLTPELERFVVESGATELHDVCAGSGTASFELAGELHRRGKVSPRFLLSDIFPHVEIWGALRDRAPQALDFVADSLDATAIPATLSRGKARLIINAFHHFPPALAASMLEDAVRNQAPIFISEPFERDPRGFLPFIPAATAAMLVNPILTPKHRKLKTLLTFGTPLVILAGFWDGLVSTARVYSEQELRDLVAPFGASYRWSYGHYEYPLGGRGYYFQGLP